MTREEALKTWLPVISMGVDNMPELKDALEMAIKALKQEPVLDKIRAEIKNASHGKWYVGRLDGKSEEVLLLDEVLQIIDKYADMRGDEE